MTDYYDQVCKNDFTKATDPRCMSYCYVGADKRKPECDSNWKRFCDANPKHSLCACFHPAAGWAEMFGSANSAPCFYQPCTEGAYMTSTMAAQAANCPQICQNNLYVKLSDGAKAYIKKNGINQDISCLTDNGGGNGNGGGGGGNGGNGGGPSTDGSGDDDGADGKGMSKQTMLLIGLAVFIFLLLFVLSRRT
jgi:hypothetical protein